MADSGQMTSGTAGNSSVSSTVLGKIFLRQHRIPFHIDIDVALHRADR